MDWSGSSAAKQDTRINTQSAKDRFNCVLEIYISCEYEEVIHQSHTLCKQESQNFFTWIIVS